MQCFILLHQHCDSHLLDGLTGDVVLLCFADLGINSRRARRVLLPCQEPEYTDESKDIEDGGPLEVGHHVG